MYAFIKYGESLIKIYDRGEDWQFLCDSGFFDKERWFTKHNTQDSLLHSVDSYFSSNGYACIDIEYISIV